MKEPARAYYSNGEPIPPGKFILPGITGKTPITELDRQMIPILFGIKKPKNKLLLYLEQLVFLCRKYLKIMLDI